MLQLADGTVARDDEDLDALLSLQTIEMQEDDPLIHMFSSGSCVADSCKPN